MATVSAPTGRGAALGCRGEPFSLNAAPTTLRLRPSSGENTSCSRPRAAVVGHETRPAEGAAELTQLPFLVGGEREPPILGREHAGRRAAARRDIAGGYRDDPRVHMLRNYRAHHGEGAVAHRDVDALERAGPVAGRQRRHDREGGVE